MTDSVALRRPESVLVLVFTSAADVLLIQRVDDPTFWQSVTGALEADETAFQAAKRELMEETGICIDTVVGAELVDHQCSTLFEISGVWRKRYSAKHTHNREHVFSLKLPQTIALQLDPDEHSDFVWLKANQALERATSPTNKQAIRDIVLADQIGA